MSKAKYKNKENVKDNKLNWKYKEKFWEKFIIKEYRNVD